MSVRGHACVRVPRVDDAGPKSAEGLVMRDGGPLGQRLRVSLDPAQR